MEVDAQMEIPGAAGKYDELLSHPGTCEPQKLKRVTAAYQNEGERFKLSHRAYDRQYAQIYFQRLMMLKSKLLQQVKKHWPGVAVCGILNLPENDDVAVLGTVYKDMKLKPSILDEYVKDRGAAQLVGRAKFVGADDALILEDESARMSLRGDRLPVRDLVTGVVMAVRGAAVPGGDFIVREWCFVGIPPQPPRPSLSEDKYIAFVSGLGVGNDAADPLRLSLVVDYLTGLLGSGEEQKLIAKIARVVIAGGLLQSTESLSQATTHSKQKQQAAALAPVKEVDLCMAELASAIPVDVMPGQMDPANQSLPQQAMHACLLPGACQFSTLNRVTNPHAFSIDGLHFVGTSGQNVDDIHRYSATEDRLAIMQSVLQWGHLVPTAPDTLTCYPFQQDDPFILEQAPHVFFVGNQPEFSAKVSQGDAGQSVLLISVPSYVTAFGVLLEGWPQLALAALQAGMATGLQARVQSWLQRPFKKDPSDERNGRGLASVGMWTAWPQLVMLTKQLGAAVSQYHPQFRVA